MLRRPLSQPGFVSGAQPQQTSPTSSRTAPTALQPRGNQAMQEAMATNQTAAAGGSMGGGLRGGGILSQMMSQNMQFLALQQSMNGESRKYQTISNALKMANDADGNSIDNIK